MHLLAHPVARLVGRLMAAYVRLVAATARIDGSVSREQAVLTFWHEYNLAAAVVAWRLRRDRHHISFSTRTFRGEVMTAMLAGLGSGSVPLPAEGDRREAARLVRDLASLGRAGSSLGVSPDGPLGPYRRAKPGALIVARDSGIPVQTWAVAVRPSLRITRRWDRHVVPLPFGRLRVFEGAPIRVAERERLRARLAELQTQLDAVAARADEVERLR